MKHLAQLDIARGLLAWWVVATHFLYFWGLPYDWLNAAQAVNLFCVISGFVIAKLVTERPEPYPTYIARRFLRLWPVFLVSTLFSMAAEHKGLGGLFWAHLCMFQGLGAGESAVWYLTPAWSVSLEWQFYLVAPALIGLVLHLRARYLILLAIMLWLPISARLIWLWNGPWPMGSFLGFKLLYFFGGIVLYKFYPRLNNWQAPNWTRGLVYLGTISYATYLVHWPILVWLSPKPNPLVAITLILTASVLLHYLVERPFIALGKKGKKPRKCKPPELSALSSLVRSSSVWP